MSALRILIADDQIPPSNIPENEFRINFFRQYGDNAQNRAFMEQCKFMGEIVQALRDSGYRVTTARTYEQACTKISEDEFDLAIVDLGWYMDFSVPEDKRPSAGWELCQQLDDKAARNNTQIPQIVFSSRFPTHPELSRDAARQQKLPLFKEATPVVRNSLMAAVGFVESTLTAQKTYEVNGKQRFERELEDIALSLFKEPLHDYRRWAKLSLAFVAISLASLLLGAFFAYDGKIQVATLTSITSLLCSTISALLYKQLGSVQKSVEETRQLVLKELQKRESKE